MRHPQGAGKSEFFGKRSHASQGSWQPGVVSAALLREWIPGATGEGCVTMVRSDAGKGVGGMLVLIAMSVPQPQKVAANFTALGKFFYSSAQRPIIDKEPPPPLPFSPGSESR